MKILEHTYKSMDVKFIKAKQISLAFDISKRKITLNKYNINND